MLKDTFISLFTECNTSADVNWRRTWLLGVKNCQFFVVDSYLNNI